MVFCDMTLLVAMFYFLCDMRTLSAKGRRLNGKEMGVGAEELLSVKPVVCKFSGRALLLRWTRRARDVYSQIWCFSGEACGGGAGNKELQVELSG